MYTKCIRKQLSETFNLVLVKGLYNCEFPVYVLSCLPILISCGYNSCTIISRATGADPGGGGGHPARAPLKLEKNDFLA